MYPVDYLLTATMTFMVFGSWILIINARRAVDGFEDAFGFHFGIPPAITSLYPSAEMAAAYAPDESARAAVPPSPTPRRNAGSKPPMLPATLEVEDLNPRPAQNPNESRQSTEKKSVQD
jgi:hypothetical protein